MGAELIPAPPTLTDMGRLATLAVATCPSEKTRYHYRTRLERFLATGLPLTRDGVAAHLQALKDAGKGMPEQRLCMAAIRKLASEARIRGLITHDTQMALSDISPGSVKKAKAGQWLTPPQVRRLSLLPDRTTYYGKRDAALLSIMLGCGLRRTEMAQLPWSCYQERDGRMCLVDLLGKGAKYRTLPIPSWAVTDIEAWRAVYDSPPPLEGEKIHLGNGSKLRDRHRSDLVMAGLSHHGVWSIVGLYGKKLGIDITPHDLRRTLAQLLRKSGAPLEQIQMTLGHESIQTTSLYLGSAITLSPGEAAVDRIFLNEENARNPHADVEIAKGEVL